MYNKRAKTTMADITLLFVKRSVCALQIGAHFCTSANNWSSLSRITYGCAQRNVTLCHHNNPEEEDLSVSSSKAVVFLNLGEYNPYTYPISTIK